MRRNDFRHDTLTWSDGNLTKLVQTETEIEDGDSYVWTETKYFDYEDADENVTKQYVPTLLVLWKDHVWFGGQFDSSMLAYIGLLGVGPEELPVSVSGEDDEDGDTWNYEYTCSYRFNSDGSVKYYSGYCSGYIEYDDLEDE